MFRAIPRQNFTSFEITIVKISPNFNRRFDRVLNCTIIRRKIKCVFAWKITIQPLDERWNWFEGSTCLRLISRTQLLRDRGCRLNSVDEWKTARARWIAPAPFVLSFLSCSIAIVTTLLLSIRHNRERDGRLRDSSRSGLLCAASITVRSCIIDCTRGRQMRSLASKPDFAPPRWNWN